MSLGFTHNYFRSLTEQLVALDLVRAGCVRSVTKQLVRFVTYQLVD